MSDNVSQMPQKPHNTLLRRMVLLIAVIAVVVAGVALYVFRDSLNLSAVRRWLHQMDAGSSSGDGTFTFDAHSSNRYCAFNGGLAVASVTGLSVYDASGEQTTLVQQTLNTPVVAVGTNQLLAYDAGGYTLRTVHRTKGTRLDISSSKPILDANISSGDWVCYATQETGYKSVLYVYNPNDTMTYRWLSSSQYLPVCAISSDGSFLAAVSLGQSDGIYESRMQIFKTDSEEIYRSFSLGSELIYDLHFWSDDLLCAVGESSVMWLRMDGTLAGKYEYGGAYLKDFDFGGDGFLTLSLNMYRAGNRSTIVTVGPDGIVLGTVAVAEELMDLSAAGKYVSVLTASKLTLYTDTIAQSSQKENTSSATAVVQKTDGSAIVLSDGKGEVYKP